ncbi:hypothetical protein COB21_04300 [Candidatus Aerophobetes bacterium]|uniref:Uncharacterized protein n=1 Tax=Aerophobetes bacterium TaxID=2030807 RepID=A0A2A4X1G5_UNCAE|nr:MAG: hypothetical protein COB21_04300 [Candidatus Aerophobetes bacterium]
MLFGTFSCGHQSPRYVKIAHKITDDTAKKLAKEKNLVLIGTGGGMMHDIQMMAMSFNFYHEVNLQEARELVVYAIREYLSDINSNEKVRPYLHNYPFTAKNVEVRIFLYEPDRNTLPPGKIHCISATHGSISYYVRGSEKYSRKNICEETYEQALKMVSLDTK